MQTKHLSHRFGGEVIAIHSVGHATEKGVGFWFFHGDIKWSGSGKVACDREIGPSALCIDGDKPEAKAELNSILDALNHYLGTEGRWHDQKSRGDLVYSWTPKKKEGSRAIEDLIAECEKVAA